MDAAEVELLAFPVSAVAEGLGVGLAAAAVEVSG